MEVKILEKKKGRLLFELHGATRTVANTIRDELWNDKKVTAATYSVDHPMKPIPRFVIETNGTEPDKAVMDALKRLQKRNKDLLAAFAKL